MNFIERGQKIGATVEAKSKQYAGTTEVAAGMMLCLFPEGIPTEKMGSALLLVRICDKMGRIAQGDGTGDEDAWGDIAGYGLIGQKHNEDEMNENATEANWCVGFPPGSIGEFMRNLEKGIEEVTERLKTFNTSRQAIGGFINQADNILAKFEPEGFVIPNSLAEKMGINLNGKNEEGGKVVLDFTKGEVREVLKKQTPKGAVLGTCCHNCNNFPLCEEGEENGEEPFPDCKGVTNAETRDSIPLGSPLPNWEQNKGALPEVAPENGKPAGLTWGMLAKVRLREDGTLFLSPDETPVDVSGLKKAPVIVHGCDDCKYGELTSEDEPCKDCGGWDAATGDTLPGWEPENG